MKTPNETPPQPPAATVKPQRHKRMTLRQLRRRCRRVVPLVLLLDFLYPYLIHADYRLKQLRRSWRRNRFRSRAPQDGKAREVLLREGTALYADTTR